jgi:hypothetical protein
MSRFIGITTAMAIVAIAIFGHTAFAQSIGDLDKISDHGTTCHLTNGGSAVECIGKLSGLGSTTTNVEVVANFFCTNRGGNNPPGQVSGQSGPIQPQNGQVTFDVVTGSGSCPDQMTPTFGPTATINVFQNGQLVFTEQVPIT